MRRVVDYITTLFHYPNQDHTMRYVKTVDIWAPSAKFADTLATVSNLQIGQWVSAGTPDPDRNNCGRFYGVTSSGSVVVAWNGNARNRAGGVKEYNKIIRDYARWGRG